MTIKNLKIKFINIFGKIKNIFFAVLYFLFILVILATFFAVYSSVRVIFIKTEVSLPISASKGVSLNFGDYDFAINRIKNGKSYIPSAPLFQNPFGNE